MRRLVPLVLALVVAAGVVVLRDRPGDAAQAAVVRAATRMSEAPSFRFTMRWWSPEVSGEAAAELSVEGAIDVATGRGRIAYDEAGEVVFDGDVVFMKWPLPELKDKWIRYEGLFAQGSVDRDPIFRADHLFDFLRRASSEVRQAGRDEVRGVPTTRYEGTLDLRKAVEQERADEGQSLDAWLDGDAAAVRFGVWVDVEGVVRRVRMDEKDGFTITVDYYDFGVPVDIALPPAEAIVSEDEFERLMDEQASSDDCASDAPAPEGTSYCIEEGVGRVE